MFGIKLYSTAPAALQPEKIEAALATFDYHGPVKVSRTVGPENWYTLNKRELASEDVSFPAKDIDGAPRTSFSEIAALSRPQSVLTVSCAGAKSVRMQAISSALHNDVPATAKGFFISSALFSFGPSDIVAYTEDEEGQDDVASWTWRNCLFPLVRPVPGPLRSFQDAVPEVGEFAKLRDDLERIVGPLKLYFPR